MKKRIKNIFGEELDVLIEGNKKSKAVVIFVHGYGTDKNEGFASFLDASNYLKKDFLIIRFDLSGYGESQGKEQEFQFQKAAGDVDSIIRFARKKYKDKDICISAHSLGCFVVALLSPFGIKKTIFTSIANSNTKFIISELKKRIKSKGGKINENGFTIYPRTSGKIQIIGKDFWRTLRAFNPCEFIKELGDKTDLIIFKPKQDEVLKNKYFKEYKAIKNIKYVEINGNHNFRDKKDRLNLFKEIRKFLLK
jgi:alpha/beta superfamily hydrolase